MTRRMLVAVLGGLVLGLASGTWAAEDEKRIVNGPSKTSLGGLELVLGQGLGRLAIVWSPARSSSA